MRSGFPIFAVFFCYEFLNLSAGVLNHGFPLAVVSAVEFSGVDSLMKHSYLGEPS